MATTQTSLLGEEFEKVTKGSIRERFVVSPFTVLNSRDGWWQKRKKHWINFGIESEVGRGACRPHGKDTSRFSNRAYTCNDGKQAKYDYLPDIKTGTSIFDPVLCELMYRWFCPHGGQIVDPFAGGSVRGVMASLLGRGYWGCDLSQEQIGANNVQGKAVVPESIPTWVCGDSANELDDAPDADMIFSCPPYGNLECYSDDPRDLSTMEYAEFVEQYKHIISLSCKCLKQDRFACFVVGNFRGKDGYYNDLVSDTTRAFESVGVRLYNEAILTTPVGSLPIRISKQFIAGRKLGRTHQNILVFVKGDWKKAVKALGAIETK